MTVGNGEQLVTLQFTLTPSDLKDTARCWRRRYRRWVVFVISLVIGAGFLGSGFTGDGAYFVIAVFYCLAAYFGLPILQRAWLRRSAARLGEVSMTIGDDGLHVSNALATSEVRWMAFRGYLENDNVFVIYEPGWPPRLRTLPKRAFPDDQSVERVRRILQSQLGPAAF